jgi:PKD repeat protein
MLVMGLWLVVLLAPAGAHAASSYGELTRFGTGAAPGEAEGQINDEERRFSHAETLRAHLIGVDPSDNSVYVLDEPKEYTQGTRKVSKAEIKLCEDEAKEEFEEGERPDEGSEKECVEEIGRSGPITRTFRVQKFVASGGKYEAVASVRFNETAAESRSGEGERLGVQGIAVDPARKRFYVLAVDARKPGGIDEVSAEQFLGVTSSSDLPVASTLFAFSTEQKGKELVPAGKAGTSILTGPGESELAAQSQTPGKALLEPAGITVDPATGDVIILAHEDPGKEVKKFEDQLYDTAEVKSPDHFVLQRIAPGGELLAGAPGRWVDTADDFKKVEQLHERTSPNSPVVVGAESEEHVDVQYENGIAAVPANFASKGTPASVYTLEGHVGGTTEGAINDIAAFHPQGRQSPLGGVLAAAPFGAEGNTIYAPTVVENEQPAVGGFTYAGVVGLSAASGAVQGWVGGQNIGATRGAGEATSKCVFNPAGGEFFAPVAAGSEGKVFVLATEFIEKAMREAWTGETFYEGPQEPAVIELGPGGGGCPEAAAGGLAAEINGEVLNGRTVTPAEPVTFSSYVNQADALNVEWDFGDGTSETVSGKFRCPQSLPSQYEEYVRLGFFRQCPSTHHNFAHGGALTVKETVHTDDLSTPMVTQTIVVNVAGEAVGPTAVAIGPEQLTPGEVGTFDGSHSHDPSGPNGIREYHWNFGDGTPEASTTSRTISHSYRSVGLYTASLTVTNKAGVTSASNTLPTPVAVVEPAVPGETVTPGSQSGASQSAASAPPGGGVGGYTAGGPPVPNVRLQKALLTLAAGGTVALTLYCPAEESSCAGKLTLTALVAAGARNGKRGKSTTTTLATGSFTLSGGQPKRLLIHLSAKARELLIRRHKLVASLTILAHDPAGAQHTTRVPVVVATPVKHARH